MRNVIIVFVFGAALSGCGGSGSPPSPVPSGLVIVSEDGVLFLGQTYMFTANLQLSNGSSNAVAGTWGSDAPSVALVQSKTGRVQIVGLGEATVFVDAQGLRATKRIRSTVNYQGRLDGGLRITGCSQTGVFAEAKICSEAPNGVVFGFIGVFTQTGQTVVATMDFGEEVGDFPGDPVSASVNGAGELRFTSEHREEDLAGTAQWVLRPSGLNQITGTAVWRVRAVGASGVWELRGSIRTQPIVRSATGDRSRGARAVADVLRGVRR